MFSYFSKVYKNKENDAWNNLIVSYQRLRLTNFKEILENIQNGCKFGEIKFLLNSSIENENKNVEAISVDFANKIIGGSVLEGGNV